MTSPTSAGPDPAERAARGRRRHEVFASMLSVFPTGRFLDLGTGHGEFALAAARLGWDTVGLDARPDRMPDDPSVRWEVGDLRDHDVTPYDVIGCLGVFYHLTLDDQLDLLRRCAGTPIILDTHVANGRSRHKLGEAVTVGGYRGRWYKEPKQLTSSWGNPASFWPNTRSLHRMLGDCGYPTVLAANPWIAPDRTFFLALPAPGAADRR